MLIGRETVDSHSGLLRCGCSCIVSHPMRMQLVPLAKFVFLCVIGCPPFPLQQKTAAKARYFDSGRFCYVYIVMLILHGHGGAVPFRPKVPPLSFCHREK